jgi:hypothetical protein
MKVGERVTIERERLGSVERAMSEVLELRGDYAYLATPGRRRAFHIRTGKPRRAWLGWVIAAREIDPRAGRGTTR